MNEASGKNLSREERLAAKLRENLRRRKAQGRTLNAAQALAGGGSPTQPLPNRADES